MSSLIKVRGVYRCYFSVMSGCFLTEETHEYMCSLDVKFAHYPTDIALSTLTALCLEHTIYMQVYM